MLVRTDQERNQWVLVLVTGGAAAISKIQKEKVTVVEERRSASQNGAPGRSQPLDLTNLFAGILVDDEPEPIEEDTATIEGVCLHPLLVW